MLKIRKSDFADTSSFEEAVLDAECSGDSEYERKLFFLEETLGSLGFPVEVDKKWIDSVECRYREPGVLKNVNR